MFWLEKGSQFVISVSFFVLLHHPFQEADTEKIFYGLGDIKEANEIIIVWLPPVYLPITAAKIITPPDAYSTFLL